MQGSAYFYVSVAQLVARLLWEQEAASSNLAGRIEEKYMTERLLNWLKGLIAFGDVHSFYCSSQWVRLSHEVLDMDKHECQICKQRGRYRRADLVHHVNHVKDAPERALDIWYTDADGNRQRNLISVCKDCHETVCHPERMRKCSGGAPLTIERWD